MKPSRLIAMLIVALILLTVLPFVSDVLAESNGPITDGVHVKPDLTMPRNVPASLTTVTFYLPWKGGQRWDTTNGHCNDGHSCEDSTNYYALDFKPANGATGDVVSVADGTVCYVQEGIGDSVVFSRPHAGNVVVIAHEGNCTERQDGTYSFYAHLKQDSVPVSAGQVISRGTVIGHYGASGYTFGAHLHFSVNSQYWVYSEFGYPTASVISKFAAFADQDVQRTGGVPRADQQYTSDNYHGFTCTDVQPVGEGSSRMQLFIDAYNRMGGRDRLGCTRGGAYWWHDPTDVRKAVRQDFTSPGGGNQVMITHNEAEDNPAGSIPAYVTWGSIYTRYMDLGGINASYMGIPTSDEFVNAAGNPQSNFTHGYITWDGDSYEFYNWPGAVTSQWRVKYYNGRTDDFSRQPTWMMNHVDPFIDINWGEGAPGSGRWGVWGDNFSMAASKSILFDAGRYRFHVKADDGVKLRVDSTVLINEWHSSSGNDYYAEMNLTQGSHLIVLNYYEDTGSALAKLDWVKVNPPSTPTLNAISNADGDGSYTVSWSTASGAASYTLQEQFNGGSFGDIYTGTSTSQNRTGRAAGQWCYRVKANNTAGSSTWSNTRCATVLSAPAAPVINAISNGDGDGNFTVSWSAVSGATNYRLQEQFNGGSFGEIYAGPNTSTARTNLAAGQWCYRAHAWNGAGISNWSSTVCTTVSDLKPDLLPFAPSGYQYPVVPSGLTGTTVEGPLTAGEESYFDWHFKNAGTAAAAAGFHVELWVDGTRHVRYPWDSMGAGMVDGFDDWMEYINSPGTHTVRLVVDPDNVVAESNENNNVWERQFTWNPPAESAAVFISSAGTGTVGGIAFTGADILRYERDFNRWTIVYDGSARGTPKNLGAFSLLPDDSLLLVFAVNQSITGLGTATPYDIVHFTPADPTSYPLGPGTYSWFFRGKSFGLTTTGEKIDAVDWVGSWLMLSTTGAAKIPLPTGAILKAADEDVFVYELNNARWRNTLLIDGSLIPGMAVEDLSGIWDDQFSDDFYISITGAFNLGGVKGNGKSIVRLTPNGGPTVFSPSLVPWLAPGVTFPANLDEVDMGRW